MTLTDLLAEITERIELLGEDVAATTPVRLAIQPNWPFEHEVGEVAVTTDADGNDVFYLGEGRQLGYLSGAARDDLFR